MMAEAISASREWGDEGRRFIILIIIVNALKITNIQGIVKKSFYDLSKLTFEG